MGVITCRKEVYAFSFVNHDGDLNACKPEICFFNIVFFNPQQDTGEAKETLFWNFVFKYTLKVY